MLYFLAEGRAAGELATTLALGPLLRRAPRGDGHPVLLLPGFLASDISTRPLRRFLRDQGWWAHRWKLGRNLGFSAKLEADLEQRLVAIHHQHGRTVSLVGWSLGGVYARAMANRRPDLVRCVITLGSPFAGPPKANNSWRLYEWITSSRIDELPPEELERFRSVPAVPTTSIFSRTDGITAWQTSLQPEGPLAESIEIPGSHLGLGFNPLALYAIADRLAEREGAWRPFFRSGVKRTWWRRPPEARQDLTEAPA